MPYPVASAHGSRIIGASGPWYLAGGISLSDCAIAYQPVGALNFTVSKINLAHPGTNNATNTIPFSAVTGWDFTAGNVALDTGWIPPNQVARSCVARISGAGTDAADRWICGSRNGASLWGIKNTNLSSKAVFSNGAQTNAPANYASGVLGFNTNNMFKDGVNLGSMGVPGNPDQGSGALSVGYMPTTAQYFNGYIQAIALYTISLSTSQMLAVMSAMASLP